MGYRNYANSNGFIVDPNGHGDFTTIAAALTAATSGKTIFLMPGTYTENIILKVGVDITSFVANSGGNVTINGKCSFTGGGNVHLSGIDLQTNNDFCISFTGSSAGVLQLFNCNIIASNHTGIEFTNSNAASDLGVALSFGTVATTGIALYTSSSAGDLVFYYCNVINTGVTTTASNNSAGIVNWQGGGTSCPLSSSGTGSLSVLNSIVDVQPSNTTALLLNGTSGSIIHNSYITAGTASAISIGTGVTATIMQCQVQSTNTNAITGLGTLSAGIITFFGTSSTINTTTVNKLTTYGGTIV